MPIIQSVERALKILDLFDERERELTITEISKRMNLHKSTVHSLLKTLQEHHYISQGEENGKYSLGLKLLERGSVVVTHLDLRNVARKHLEGLSATTNLTLHLVILDGQEGVYVDKVEGTGVTVLYSRIGRRVPIHTSAVGKSLVATKTDSELDLLLDGYDYTGPTEKSIRSKEQFLAEIEKARINGYSMDNEENEPGIFCLAVPIRDYSGKVIAAMSVSMPASKVNEETHEFYVRLLKECSSKISQELGYEYQKI
ncbi:Transcriptional regulator KdgR [Peribacillus frigoritolerans]|uniref:IclR family transcriptional regulator n=1 Tax=Peribacillus frigoritolerans TaxID=450367 RepID=UPI000BAC951F|nr:IclR family transcriptional regulator [Peribacillus frigoritolerans]MED3708538.1 IclR family transcriptional regulator [Peribacillus frigoritolerans]MED3893032.1 IclR family transcriptional regulator [Peribacillus frigoritolerans]PAW27813.1 IclR family transcriptional regulator [Peribacillus simplex]CAH0297288.1 Transcriptional regulator KdgR [Peribacillus frigoritolerans]